MKYFIYLSLVLFIASCENKTNKVSNNSLSDQPKADSLITDSVLTFSFETNFSHPNISNNSDRQVDLLFNGVDNYLGGHLNPKVDFKTEGLPYEPIQEFLGGLLFAKRFLILSDQIKFHKKDFNINDSLKRIKPYMDDRGKKNPQHRFSDGKAHIKNIGVSCNDADFNKVRLSYSTGEIIIDSMINASFFEYDLNLDGQMEQYLLGARSCSRELVLLRIRKSNDK
ncbi:MAG: hypothetical protein KA501_10790 [Bacteroidia bacterium]|nr:hypothetical protein [Bacteroidia bacterium]